LFAQAANASPNGLTALSRPQSRLHRCLEDVKGGLIAIAENAGMRAWGWFRRPSVTPDRSLTLQKELSELWRTEPHYSEKQLASISVRTAIVIGDHDDVVRLDHTKYLARTILRAQLIILYDVGHAAVVQDPVGYARAVLGFVDTTTPARP
jgi:pimeloyl-ACP methyl ester carboxylesterase